MMTKNFEEEIGAALLDDPHLSVYSRLKLTTFLNLPMADLRMVAGVKDDASLSDVISFIVDETCSEIVGLKMHECTTKNMFLMTCDSDEIPIEDKIPEISATESSVAKLQHLVNISEKAVAVVDTLKSPVKKHVSKANWPALPPQFLSTNQPDPTILVDDTGIENFGLTHDMTGQKFSASEHRKMSEYCLTRSFENCNSHIEHLSITISGG